MSVSVQTQEVSRVADGRFLGCRRGDLGKKVGRKQKNLDLEDDNMAKSAFLTPALPGSQHQTAVRWVHVTAALHWGLRKKRILLQTDHSGHLGHSWIPSLDCLRPLESNAHLQTQEASG